MEPGFRLTVDNRRALLAIELWGFFEAADVARFAAEKQAVHKDLACAPNGHVTLVDVTACRIQPQVVVGAFATLIADPRYRSRRLAIVTGSSLAAMQVRRLIDGRLDARCFEDRPAAEAWLMETRSAAAA